MLYKAFQNSLVQIITKVLTIAVGIVMVKVLTDAFGASGYGLYAKVHNYAAIFAALADLGLFTITVRDLSANKEDKSFVRKRIGEVAGLRLGLGIMLSVFALGLAFFLPNYDDPLTIWSILITQIFVLFGLQYSTYLSYLQANLRTEFTFVSTLVGRLVTLGLTLYVAYAFFTTDVSTQLVSVFVAALVGNVVMTMLLGWYTERFEKVKITFSLKPLIGLIRDNAWYIAAMFFGLIFLRVDVLMISMMLPEKVANEQVGYYGVAIKLVEVAIYFGHIVLNSFLPLFVGKLARERRRGIAHASILLAVGGLLFGVICFLVSPWIIHLISDTNFVSISAPVLKMVSWSVVFHYFGLLASFLMISKGFFRQLFFVNVSIFAINVVLNLFLISGLGISGAAMATVISQALFAFVGTVTFLVNRRGG